MENKIIIHLEGGVTVSNNVTEGQYNALFEMLARKNINDFFELNGKNNSIIINISKIIFIRYTK
jgi:hypothetical protein